MDYQFIPTTNTLIIKDGKGLFIKRDENLEDFPGWLMLPGGKQEANETPFQAAIREVFEETGLKIADPKLNVIATHNHEYESKIYIVYIFTVNEFTGKLIDFEEGKGKPVWIELNKAMNDPKLYPDLKRHISLVRESMPESIIFTYHKFSKDLEIIESL